jgi:hypothetical protein
VSPDSGTILSHNLRETPQQPDQSDQQKDDHHDFHSVESVNMFIVEVKAGVVKIFSVQNRISADRNDPEQESVDDLDWSKSLWGDLVIFEVNSLKSADPEQEESTEESHNEKTWEEWTKKLTLSSLLGLPASTWGEDGEGIDWIVEENEKIWEDTNVFLFEDKSFLLQLFQLQFAVDDEDEGNSETNVLQNQQEISITRAHSLILFLLKRRKRFTV